MSFFIGMLVGILLAYLIPAYYIYKLPKDKLKYKLSQQEGNLQVTLNVMTCSCYVNNTPCTIQLHKCTLLMTSMHKSVDISNAHIYYHQDTLVINTQSNELIVIRFLTQEELWCWYMALIQRSTQFRNSHMTKSFSKLYAHTSMIDPSFEQKDTFFNLMIGRQFIAYTTSKYWKDIQLHHLSERLNAKMKSDYFQNIKITHLDFADPPKFQDLKVIGLEEDGTILVDGQFEYSGLQMSLEVSVNLKVPGFNFFTSTTSSKEATDAAHNSGFLLNVSFNFVVKQLKGKILLKFPSLPVNQLFYGFYNDPTFEVSVEPKVSNRQLKIGVLGSLLEKRILYFNF